MSRRGTYGDVSLWDIGYIVGVKLRIPFTLATTCIVNLLYYRHDFRRATASAMIRWFNNQYSVAQLQYTLPKSVDAYKGWASTNKLPILVEELAEDTSIMWIGPKRTDKVVLYFHGGGFVAPLLGHCLDFWLYTLRELKRNECEVGFAVLGYTLVPVASFPTQIRQAVLAVEHIVASGVHPSNLSLVGDSAGAQLIISLLSHILHPLDGIRSMTPIEEPIGNVYLMSPWVRLRSKAVSYWSDNNEDLFSPAYVEYLGGLFLAHVPENARSYAEPGTAPDTWFEGLGSVARRILITAGSKELFRDDITEFSRTLEGVHTNTTYIVQEGGIHDDPFLDFLVQLPHDQLGSLTPLIIHWLAEGIKPPR